MPVDTPAIRAEIRLADTGEPLPATLVTFDKFSIHFDLLNY